ncbi:MAG: hypothetical protein Q8O67_09415 [Deltaproteobacteria bacterium]|nr:hypothetical protein [Deltaproteobacteria bacterium]
MEELSGEGIEVSLVREGNPGATGVVFDPRLHRVEGARLGGGGSHRGRHRAADVIDPAQVIVFKPIN